MKPASPHVDYATIIPGFFCKRSCRLSSTNSITTEGTRSVRKLGSRRQVFGVPDFEALINGSFFGSLQEKALAIRPRQATGKVLRNAALTLL